MSWITVFGIIMVGWVLLRQMGAERQREMVNLAKRIAKELEEARLHAAESQPQPTPVPVPLTPPVPIPGKKR